MNTYFIVVLLSYCVLECASNRINVEELRCLVCQTTIQELEKIISKIDPTKTVQVGDGRLDAAGNYKQKTVPQAKSELHLSELIEGVCEKMDDYVRATQKSDGKLILMKLVGDDGQMNMAMSDVDIIQDDDLNKSLKYNCESLVEEHEEDIIKQFIDDPKKAESLCPKISTCSTSFGPRNEL